MKIKRVFDKAAQVGALAIQRRDELTSEEKAKIEGFLLQLRLRLLKLLKESKLIREPEAQGLVIEELIVKEIRKMGVTLEMKKQDNKKLDEQFKPFCLGTVFRQFL